MPLPADGLEGVGQRLRGRAGGIAIGINQKQRFLPLAAFGQR